MTKAMPAMLVHITKEVYSSQSSKCTISYCENIRVGKRTFFEPSNLLTSNARLRIDFFKDVRANCLCTSLLRTQFMSQRHATSCTSARTKKEIYSHKGMVSAALTSLRFNSLE